MLAFDLQAPQSCLPSRGYLALAGTAQASDEIPLLPIWSPEKWDN